MKIKQEMGVWYRCDLPDHILIHSEVSKGKVGKGYGAKLQINELEHLTIFLSYVNGYSNLECTLYSGNWRLCQIKYTIGLELYKPPVEIKEALVSLQSSFYELAEEIVGGDLLIKHRRDNMRTASYEGFYITLYSMEGRTDWNALFLDYLLQIGKYLTILYENLGISEML